MNFFEVALYRRRYQVPIDLLNEVLLLPSLDGVNSVSLSLFKSFFKTIRLHSQLVFKMTSEKGIYPGQALCLWFINQQPGISQCDLAKRMHVAPPTVTHMLQKLEKTGFITRMVDEHDQRLSRIYLTDTGSSMLQALNSTFSEIISISLKGLTQGQQQELIQTLNIMSSNISQEM
jgi:DNA-binding MarR family transcriptional regulator